MGMNDTPRGERLHIALFGRRNAGKSSLINAITGQKTAIVSEHKGTTTDPVYKAMELLPLGPVVLIDTPGLDDEGELGQERIKKTREVLDRTDLALVLMDGSLELSTWEDELVYTLKERKIPFLFIINKEDQMLDMDQKVELKMEISDRYDIPSLLLSASKGTGVEELKQRLGQLEKVIKQSEKRIVGDLVTTGDFVLLVIPIDKAAPKGRLILPQQQTIRDLLDAGASVIVVRDTELKDTLKRLPESPKLIITDSQAFGKVSQIVPKDVLLTSFSILFARYKGELSDLVQGAKVLEELQDGDRILMAEGCTHHRQCDDIGTVKIPAWIRAYTKKEILIETSSGNSFPKDLSSYKMIVHCGACTLNEKEMKSRMERAKEQQIPMVNYGILIAYMNGILKRSLEPFPDMNIL